MNTKEIVERWLFDPRSIVEIDNRVDVTTTCLYPSMSAVVITVEGGKDTFLVHDGMRAVREASASGARFEKVSSLLRSAVRPYGLEITETGAIRSHSLPASDVGAAIVVVANASREAAGLLIGRRRAPVLRDAKQLVRRILLERFAESRVHTDFRIIGASSKAHRFDYVVDAENGSQLLFDIVLPEASSINSAIVANLDVMRRQAERAVVPRLVYDDERDWKPQDLALLGVTDRPIRLSALSRAVERLAA
jgi:hypothetical protein